MKASVGRDTITVRVRLSVRRRGGRKTVIVAVDPAKAITQPLRETAVANALGRAFRWRQLIETGVYSTLAELAAAEGVTASYCSRLLRLTLLAPELVETNLASAVGTAPRVKDFLSSFPLEWLDQRQFFIGSGPPG